MAIKNISFVKIYKESNSKFYEINDTFNGRINEKFKQATEYANEKNYKALVREMNDLNTLIRSFSLELKSLYEKGTQLEEMKQQALEVLAEEKRKLTEAEKDVKVLEKHKERMREIYIEEEKAAELKRLSEVAVQKFFARRKEEEEDAEREARRKRQ